MPFELCSRVLISTLFLIIFLLFISLDTSGTWNVNRPATKTSTQDTYSALPGLKIFILTKNREERCKSRTISRGAHRERHLSYVCVC